jgi:hypothetical protein
MSGATTGPRRMSTLASTPTSQRPNDHSAFQLLHRPARVKSENAKEARRSWRHA